MGTRREREREREGERGREGRREREAMMDAASLSRLRVKLPKWHLRRWPARYRPVFRKLALRNPASDRDQIAGD